MQPKDTILKLLKTKKVMQLATVRNGQPWVCSLHFWADDDASLYWISTEALRHSLEIKDDPRVAAAIAVQTDEAVPEAPSIGIQVEGDAEIVSGPDSEVKLRKYFDYQHKSEQLYEDILSGKNPHKLYRLKPRLYVIFDAQNSPDDPRKEWNLND